MPDTPEVPGATLIPSSSNVLLVRCARVAVVHIEGRILSMPDGRLDPGYEVAGDRVVVLDFVIEDGALIAGEKDVGAV